MTFRSPCVDLQQYRNHQPVQQAMVDYRTYHCQEYPQQPKKHGIFATSYRGYAGNFNNHIGCLYFPENFSVSTLVYFGSTWQLRSVKKPCVEGILNP